MGAKSPLGWAWCGNKIRQAALSASTSQPSSPSNRDRHTTTMAKSLDFWPKALSSHRLKDRDGFVGTDRVANRNRNLRLSRINEESGDLERFA